MQAAATYGTTMWSGEWGGFTDPAALMPTIAAFARLQDETLTGGAWWQWSQACGDPHTINDAHGHAPTGVVAFNRYSCPGSHLVGPVPQWSEILSRSYPIASPGRLASLSSDPPSGTLHLTGSGHGTLVLWVPARIGICCRLTGSGLGRVASARVPGGWQVTVPTSGAYRIDLGPR